MTETWSRPGLHTVPCENVFLNMQHNSSHTHVHFVLCSLNLHCCHLHKSADCCMQLLKLKMVLCTICLPFPLTAISQPSSPKSSSFLLRIVCMYHVGTWKVCSPCSGLSTEACGSQRVLDWSCPGVFSSWSQDCCFFSVWCGFNWHKLENGFLWNYSTNSLRALLPSEGGACGRWGCVAAGVNKHQHMSSLCSHHRKGVNPKTFPVTGKRLQLLLRLPLSSTPEHQPPFLNICESRDRISQQRVKLLNKI